MKKKYFFILFLITSTLLYSQRGVKIGYIDTEYILENLPEYIQVSKRLEQKAGEWKNEIEERSRKIQIKKESLNSERILLTKDMIEEIEDNIMYDEEQLNEYQQNRFGPRGDLIIQKQQLIQPIQDQIFNALRELAKSRDYDFIFDKSADIVMLYSDKRYDLSDQILRTISRANNRKKLDSRKEKKEAQNKNNLEEPKVVFKEDENKDENINDKKTENTNKKLTVKELLELRKQKNSNKRKVKD